MLTNRSAGQSLVILITLATFGGCNDHQKAATQVAAKVNGAEITVSQVNGVLTRVKGVTAENADAAKREVLDKLIDQQLAVERALDKKLDRNPHVMQAIEASKREILARAYLEQVASAQPKPTTDEAKKFYVDHPALFAERRLYNLQELAVAADGAPVEDINQWVSSGTSMTDIAAALKARNIQFRANAGPSAAEQLPLELLPKFQALKDGETTILQGPKALLVVHLVESKPQPVDQATALPRIEQFIANQRNKEAIAKEMKALRDQAKIEKLGEFAAELPTPAAATASTSNELDTAQLAPTGAGSPTASAPTATETADTAAPAVVPAVPAAADDKAIAKGIAGLK